MDEAIPEAVRRAAGTAAIAVKTVGADLRSLEEYFESDKTGEIYKSLFSQHHRVYLQCVALGREMRYGDSLEITGLSALLLRATIEDAVAVTHSTLALLGGEKSVDLLQQLNQSSGRALAELQVVIDQMGIESRE
jgi:hypothetical protein